MSSLFFNSKRVKRATYTRFITQPLSRQRGIALITVLMITLIIMVLSISLATGVFSEHRLSRNAADLAIARQAAEAALRDAEHDIACEQWNGNQFVQNTTSNPHRCPLEVGKQSFNPQSCTDGWVTASLSTNSATAPLPNYFSDSNCYREFGSVTNQPKFTLFGVVPSLQPQQPRYSIEVFNKSTGGKVGITNYRITARGYGRNPNTTVDLQSIFRPVAQ
jgi:type IV pilus assembly protein PilX